MAARTVPHPLFLASLLAILLGTPAAAQGSAARALDDQAARAFEAGTAAKYLEAGALWSRAAVGYLDNGWTTDAAISYRHAGLALTRAGADSTALQYYGRAVELENPAASHQVRVLLEESPAVDPAGRGIAEEARFVSAVNRILAAVGPEAPQVATAEDAQTALENLAVSTLAPITLRSEAGPVVVRFRRWSYARRQPNAPWEQATTNVTLRRSPAAYDFRYSFPATAQETKVTILCADGCELVIR